MVVELAGAREDQIAHTILSRYSIQHLSYALEVATIVLIACGPGVRRD